MAPRASQISSLLQATHRLSLASPAGPVPSSQRSASWSLSSIRAALLPKGKTTSPIEDAAAAREQTKQQKAQALTVEQPKGLFDAALEDSEVQEVAQALQPKLKAATFHKSSTSNFKTSRRKLNDLSRLIAGRGVDEAVLQLKVSPKKQSSRLLSMLALARDHAIAKGLRREDLVVAQSWTTPGPSLKRLDIKGRGRHGVKHHPSSKLHVLLAEGKTKEEQRRERKMSQFRAGLRGMEKAGGMSIEGSRPVINVGVGEWRW